MYPMLHFVCTAVPVCIENVVLCLRFLLALSSVVLTCMFFAWCVCCLLFVLGICCACNGLVIPVRLTEILQIFSSKKKKSSNSTRIQVFVDGSFFAVSARTKYLVLLVAAKMSTENGGPLLSISKSKYYIIQHTIVVKRHVGHVTALQRLRIGNWKFCLDFCTKQKKNSLNPLELHHQFFYGTNYLELVLDHFFRRK